MCDGFVFPASDTGGPAFTGPFDILGGDVGCFGGLNSLLSFWFAVKPLRRGSVMVISSSSLRLMSKEQIVSSLDRRIETKVAYVLLGDLKENLGSIKCECVFCR